MIPPRRNLHASGLDLYNATIQVQRFCDETQVGTDGIHEQATVTRNACELAGVALAEAEPALRRPV